MSDTTESDKKKRLGLSRPGKLVLNKTVKRDRFARAFHAADRKP